MSDLPAVLFVEDIVRVLRTSKRTVARLRRCGTFPIAELPAIDKRPRWSRDAVLRYLDGQRDTRRLRRVG